MYLQLFILSFKISYYVDILYPTVPFNCILSNVSELFLCGISTKYKKCKNDDLYPSSGNLDFSFC